MAVILEARNLQMRFGAVVAADDINVSVGEGEVIGIIGANGAGKTTFVNMVTGYLTPTSGQIFFEGRDVTALDPRQITRLGICRSFQIAQLFPEFTVLDNVLVALGIAKRRFFRPMVRPDMVTAGLRVLEHYGLSEHAERTVSTLPQGTRKLLDIALATVEDPKIVLLDEPTSGVGVDEKFGLMKTLMSALQAQGATVLYIEHDMELIERYAHRVIAFYDGKIIADAPPAEAFADDAVREFVIGAELHRKPKTEDHGDADGEFSASSESC